MAMHAVLYRNAAVAISASFASMPIIPYTADNVGNNQLLPPATLELCFAAAFGATLSAARVQTPLLLETASDWLVPFNQVAAIATNFNLVDYTPNPVKFNSMENVNIQTSNSSGAATDDQFVILMFGDGNYTKPSGKYLKIRLTAAFTQVANAWNSVTLVPDESLPNKRFSIIGFSPIAATGILGRLDIPGWNPGGKNYHPGFPALLNVGMRLPYPLYDFPFGEIGQFTNQTIPRLEIYSKAADAAQTVFMDIIQTGSN